MKTTKGKSRGIRKPKGYVPGDNNKNSFIASYGKISGEAAHFFEDCTTYIKLNGMTAKCGEKENVIRVGERHKPLMDYFGITDHDVDAIPKTLGEDIVNHLLCAMEQRDGKFFRDLAELCEKGRDFDNLKSWLRSVHFAYGSGFQSGKQDAFYTSKELVAMLESYEKISAWMILAGKHESKEKAIRRACAVLGIQLKS